MLIQFAVENYLSFHEKTVFSMRAAEPKSGHPSVDRETGNLRCAAIYGGNASGKSNLVKALQALQGLVVNGVPANHPIPTKPFRLALSGVSRPTRFEIFFRTMDDKVFSYGLAVTGTLVVEEWLTRLTPNGEEPQPLFERGEDSEGVIKIGPALARTNRRREFLQFVAEGTRPNQVFLRECAERNVHELAEVYEWFARNLLIIGSFARPSPALASQVEKSEELRSAIIQLLRAAGTGIEDVQTIRQPSEGHLLSAARESLIRAQGLGLEAAVEVSWHPDYGEGMFAAADGTVDVVRLKTIHHDNAGASHSFDALEESDGTLRLMNFALWWREAVKFGRVLIVDEFDRSLHPLMTRLLLESFVFEEGAQKGQLIFTTHDTNLLDLTLLEPDCVWFIEKDRGGRSVLYSLAEYKDEQLEALRGHVQRGYLQGRFGAIPFLADAGRLGWLRRRDGDEDAT